MPRTRMASLPEPRSAFPTLTGGFSDFVPENRLYREQIGTEARPFYAAFGDRLSARMNMNVEYRRQSNQRGTP